MNKYKNVELKKHVSTIHCANALTLLQRKIANALLFHAYEDLLLKEEFEVSIKELCELIGYDSHDYKSIKKALIELLSTVIQWNVLEEGLPESEGEWNASSIIADASIKGSICTYSYSKRMKQLLYMPVIYGRLNMKVMSKFKSGYGLALYENVVRYQNIDQTPWFTLEVFRKLMGVPNDKYIIFRDFKRRVLDKAVLEVNQISALTITSEFQRQNRAVVSIRFLLEKNKLAAKDATAPEIVQNALKKRLRIDYGFNLKQLEMVLANYPEEYIFEKMTLIENSSSFKNGNINNLSKYLLQALQDNYQKPKASKEAVKLQRQKHENKELSEKHEAKSKEQLKMQYGDYISEYLLALFQQLNEEKRKKILEQFAESIQNLEMIYKRFKKEGLNSKIVFMEFKHYIRENHPDWFENCLSFDKFCQQG